MRVLASLHLADLFRDPRMTIPTKNDWSKGARFLAGTWPKRLPERVVIDENNCTDLIDWLTEWSQRAAESKWLVIDTEYDRDTKDLTLIGAMYHAIEGDYKTPGVQIRWPKLPMWVRDSIYRAFLYPIERTTTVFQNIMADVPRMEQVGIVPADYKRMEDTMLAHSPLWSEWPHTLEFLASMYSPYEKMKHLHDTDFLLYNWGDVIDTDVIWEHLERELDADPPTKAIYQQQSLEITKRITLPAKKTGIRINERRVREANVELQLTLKHARMMAHAWMGYPFKLGSVGGTGMVAKYLYGDAGMPAQYSKKSYGKDRKVTVAADAIAQLRARLDPIPDFEDEERNGLSVGAALERTHAGADPILEARVVYAAALQSESHYIRPALFAIVHSDGRFYPDFLLHSQTSGRWSTVDPPLAQLPDDLRDIIYPNDGTVWIGWDSDQIELRGNAVMSNDVPTIEAFKAGWDVHTLNMCDCFGYPYPPERKKPWEAKEVNAEWLERLHFQGKDDGRRVFAKRFVYRLDYGGDPANAGDIPGARTLGLDSKRLVQASQFYLAAHPNKAQWRTETAQVARKTLAIRTCRGRRRRLLGEINKAIREAFNHPMQGGAADYFNETAVLIATAFPMLWWMYGMHDSQWWQTPKGWSCGSPEVEALWSKVKPIVERVTDVFGAPSVYPATFKQCCSSHKDCFKKELRWPDAPATSPSTTTPSLLPLAA